MHPQIEKLADRFEPSGRLFEPLNWLLIQPNPQPRIGEQALVYRVRVDSGRLPVSFRAECHALGLGSSRKRQNMPLKI